MELRPAVAVLVLVGVLAVGASGSLVVTDVQSDDQPEQVESIPLPGEDRELWLYTSADRTFASPTLALNVVVYGDDDDVRDVGGTNDEWRSARWRSRRTRRRRRDDDAWVFAVRRWEDLRRRGRGSKERARVRVTDVRTRGD